MIEITKVKGWGRLGWAVWVSGGVVGNAFWRNWRFIWDLKREREESARKRAGKEQGATGSWLVGGTEGGGAWLEPAVGRGLQWLELRKVCRSQISVGLIGHDGAFTFHLKCNALWHVKGSEGPYNRATCLTRLTSVFPKCCWPSCSANKRYLQDSCVSWKIVLEMLICECKTVAALGTQVSRESRSLGHRLVQWRWDLKKWNVYVCRLWT